MEKRKIHDRELTHEETELIAEINQKGAEFHLLVEKLKQSPNTDLYWIDEGVLDIKKGLMALKRSVSRPQNF